MDVKGWLVRTVACVVAASGGMAATPSAAQVSGPALQLSASTVEAGGTVVAIGDCGGLIANTSVHVYVFRVHPQDPPGLFNELFSGELRDDGTYEIPIQIPGVTVPGVFKAVVSCTFDRDQVVGGDEVTFEVTASTTTVPPTSPSTLVVVPSTTDPARAPSEPAPASPIGATPAYTG